MSNKCITIGRQFGSNGHIIGQKLAERLGITCYDKYLIELAAEHMDIPAEQLALVDEKKESPWRYLSDVDQHLGRQYRYEQIDEELFKIQSRIIKELAQKSDCIFVGRCADFALMGEQNVKNLFFYASPEVRVKNIMERYKTDEKQAIALLKRVDRDRSYYYNYHTDRKWSRMENYDLSIDTGAFTLEQIVDLLEAVYRQM